MALNEADCDLMIREARQNQVKLMIAYRLQFARSHIAAIETVASGQIGIPRIFNSVFSFQVNEGNVRLQKTLGGGPLYDIGIYCINAARHLFGEEPHEVFAMNASLDDPKFREVAESTSATLHFSDGRVATFTCSFGAARVSAYDVVGTKAVLRSDPAYERAGTSKHYLIADGQITTRVFPEEDQFARELAEFSRCVLEGQDPQPSGQEGLADVRIIQALLRSAEIGEPVKL